MSTIANEISIHENNINKLKTIINDSLNINEKLFIKEKINIKQQFILSLYKIKTEEKESRSKSPEPKILSKQENNDKNLNKIKTEENESISKSSEPKILSKHKNNIENLENIKKKGQIRKEKTK